MYHHGEGSSFYWSLMNKGYAWRFCPEKPLYFLCFATPSLCTGLNEIFNKRRRRKKLSPKWAEGGDSELIGGHVKSSFYKLENKLAFFLIRIMFLSYSNVDKHN